MTTREIEIKMLAKYVKIFPRKKKKHRERIIKPFEMKITLLLEIISIFINKTAQMLIIKEIIFKILLNKYGVVVY